MKTYVINLPQSLARRRHIEAQLIEAELDHEFVRAVDGARLTDEQRELVDHEAVQRSYWLVPGIIGGALSHLEAYRRFVVSGDTLALVVEDDAVLNKDLTALLVALASEMTGAEVALLNYRSNAPPIRLSRQDAIDVGTGLQLAYPMQLAGLISGAAYLITKEAAERMADFILPVRATPDQWSFFYDNEVLDRVRCVVPRPVGTRTDFDSTISYRERASVVQALTEAISERRVFPLSQLLSWYRARLIRKASLVEFTDEPSPYSGRRCSSPR